MSSPSNTYSQSVALETEMSVGWFTLWSTVKYLDKCCMKGREKWFNQLLSTQI